MSQVVSGTEVAWEDPIIMRRDRMPTLTVLADARGVLPSVFDELRAAKNRADQVASRIFA